ncbi:hypothetical protein [Brasilonema bromeliae]|uniref:hypothetical protein n=1 Tax=Brasilonema bromeliae TaxID=383615 RepID=UPI001B7D26B4|nr:hypothetical protein [Brasilonema bromeliae]
MQDPKLDMINVFKLEKRLQLLVAIYISLILLVLTFVLVRIPMTSDLQQALIIILGLITIATIDAFRKVLGNTSSSSLVNEFKQIIVQDGGSYVDGNVDGIDKRINVEGNYVASGAINYGYEKKQNLAEAAAEIQDLLQQLEKSNPTASEAEKVAYVDEEIEPDLKSRLVKALKTSGEVAIESSLDSRYIDIIRAIIKSWSSSE